MKEERKIILSMLEDGKITAHEAERLLKALNEQPDTDAEQETSTEPGSLSKFVDWERWEERKQTYKQQSGGFRFSQYIENFIQKLKDVDFDFHFGSHETVKHIYQDQPKDFSEIKIDIKNGSIELTPWENDYVQVDCDVKVYKVKDSEEARRQFLSETRFDIVSDMLTFQCDTRDVKVNAIVSVPQKMYDSIDCKLFNGSMEGRRLQTKELFVKTVNGSITCLDTLALRGELETGNGSITASGEVNNLEIEAINGSVDVNGSFRDLDVESFSGSIIAVLQSDGYASLKSTTSSITVTVPSDIQINGELATAIGSVHCELHSFEVIREKKEMAQRLLKFVSRRKLDRFLTLEASTKTGAITVLEQGEK